MSQLRDLRTIIVPLTFHRLTSVTTKRELCTPTAASQTAMETSIRLFLRLVLALLLLLLLQTGASAADTSVRIGVNYGRVADDLPSPSEAVALVKQLGFAAVKIFDANADVLQALQGSDLSVSIMVPNQEIAELASRQSSADAWVQKYVVAYYPFTSITTVNVGNEVLSDGSIRGTVWSSLVQAMENIYSALVKVGLSEDIQVSTPLASDVLSNSYPPSSGTFKSELDYVIAPLLSFLSRTRSSVSANIYPYFAWSNDMNDISLDYALFGSSSVVVQDGKYGYTNLFDAMVDALVAAMERMGYRDLPIVISETGWPSAGATGATVTNAAIYNNRLVQKMQMEQGTPRRPQVPLPTYIFALFNEDLKPGAATEKHWGVAYPNTQPVYSLVLSRSVDSEKDGPSRQWCLANPNASEQSLQKGIDYACSHANCNAIQSGQGCYNPNTLLWHASYAFNSYWVQNKNAGGTCDFNGAAFLSSTNPSYQGCEYA